MARTCGLGLLAGLALSVLSGPGFACGGEEACRTASGEYRIRLPEGPGPYPVLVWLHGWGGSAAGAIANRGLTGPVLSRGMAVIAAEGIVSNPERPNRNWGVADGRPHPRDDIAFLREVVEDAAARHGIDREAVLLGGFSRGGSMVWDVACRAPGLARAYLSVAGAFWEPMPEGCAAPVAMFHVHGWNDRVVPLEGRPLGGGVLTQGDVFESLAILRRTNGCANRQPAQAADGTPFWHRVWSDCRAGRIDFLLHAGGHTLPGGWLERALDWFAARRGAR